MPVPFYRSLSDRDAGAIAAYLRSLPPTVDRVRPRPAASRRRRATAPSVAGVPDPSRAQVVAHGAYLGNLGHCMLCHTPAGADGKRDFAHRLGAGGFPVETASGSRLSANITPDPKTGIGAWSDAEITAALTHGVAADGSALSTIMPWPYLGHMEPEDVRALAAWLRSLPPVENAVLQ